LGLSPSTARKKSSSPEEGTTSQDKEIPVLLEAREKMALDKSLEEDNSSEENGNENGRPGSESSEDSGMDSDQDEWRNKTSAEQRWKNPGSCIKQMYHRLMHRRNRNG
jgi:hypothetical protein